MILIFSHVVKVLSHHASTIPLGTHLKLKEDNLDIL